MTIFLQKMVATLLLTLLLASMAIVKLTTPVIDEPVKFSIVASTIESVPVHTAQAAQACGRERVLIGLDAEVPLFDTPENGIIRFTLPVDSRVRVVDAVEYIGNTWCLVEPLDGVRQGWVTTEVLTQPMDQGST